MKAFLICMSPWLILLIIAAWHFFKTNPENPNNDHQ